MQDLKNTLTTYAAIAMGIATTILGLPLAVAQIDPSLTFTLPSIVNVICGIVIAASIGITQVLTGRNADGSKKTPEQIAAQK